MDKSRKKSREPIKQPHGGALIPGAGNGCAKGAPNAGRPPDQWKASLRGLADRDAVLAHVDAALIAGPRRMKLDDEGRPVMEVTTNAKGEPTIRPVWLGSEFFESALQYVTDHGYGKAASSIDVTTKGQSLNAQTIVIGGRTIEF